MEITTMECKDCGHAKVCMFQTEYIEVKKRIEQINRTTGPVTPIRAEIKCYSHVKDTGTPRIYGDIAP